MEKNKKVFPESVQSLRAVGIPPKTKCCVCKRVKQIHQFSTKQLDELRLRVRRVGQVAAVPQEGLIRCRDCSGYQNTSMKCIMCLKTKSLEGFSLAQRSKKDDAICLLCQEDLDETHPDDRKLTTGHDNTLAYSKREEDEDDVTSTAPSQEVSVWLWNRETGDYATEGSFVSRSDQGVPLPRSSASTVSDVSKMSIRPWTGRRPVPMPTSQTGSTALTRKNLAKLTVSDKAGSRKGLSGDPDSDSSSSSSSGDEMFGGAGVALRAEAGNSGGMRLPPPLIGKGKGKEKAKVDDSSSSSEEGGALFRAYDPTGGLHMRRRAPSTVVSGPSAAAGPAGGWHGHKYVSSRPREFEERDEDRRRAFARVRPQNAPTRKYVDDDIPKPSLLPHATPSRTGISTGVMEDMSSDED